MYKEKKPVAPCIFLDLRKTALCSVYIHGCTLNLNKEHLQKPRLSECTGMGREVEE